jgi:hypothetical protein
MDELKECLALCEKVETKFGNDKIAHLTDFCESLRNVIEQREKDTPSKDPMDDEDEAPPEGADEEIENIENDMFYTSHMENAERDFISFQSQREHTVCDSNVVKSFREKKRRPKIS